MKSLLISLILFAFPCVSFAEDSFENELNSDFQESNSEIKHEGCSNGMCSLSVMKNNTKKETSTEKENKKIVTKNNK